MSADDATGQPGATDGRPPVLPHAGARNPALDRLVRENLRRLSEVTDDSDLQRRMREVVAGRASLRDLAFSGDFQSFLEPLVESGLQHWQSLPESEREAYAAQGLGGDLPVYEPGDAGTDARDGDDAPPRDEGGPGGGRGPAGTW